MQVDVGQLRELRVARVHAAHVTAERHLPSLRVGRIVEVVVTLPATEKSPDVKPGQGCAGCRRRRACPAPANPYMAGNYGADMSGTVETRAPSQEVRPRPPLQLHVTPR